MLCFRACRLRSRRTAAVLGRCLVVYRSWLGTSMVICCHLRWLVVDVPAGRLRSISVVSHLCRIQKVWPIVACGGLCRKPWRSRGRSHPHFLHVQWHLSNHPELLEAEWCMIEPWWSRVGTWTASCCWSKLILHNLVSRQLLHHSARYLRQADGSIVTWLMFLVLLKYWCDIAIFPALW